MLSADELEGYIEKTGMQNLWQVERDYLQHIILRAIYSKVSDGLVFKGGTALQKFGIVNRFSIDLDFTSSLGNDELLAIAAYVSGFLGDLGIRNVYSHKGLGAERGKSAEVTFEIEGPNFAVSRSEKAKAKIKLQISRREAVLLGQKAESVNPIYRDIPPYVVAAMHMEEIAAEKVRAIMTRDKPRDVYDLSVLVKKGYSLLEFLVRKKLENYEAFSIEGFEKAMDKKSRLWDGELKNLLYYNQGIKTDLPKFEDAKSSILGFFKDNISLTAEFDLAGQWLHNDRGKTVMAESLAALNDNVKIEGVHVYPPFDARIIAFFYAKYEGMHMEVYESGNPLMELPGAIAFPQSTESLGLRNVHVKKGADVYFQLFMENKGVKPEGIAYASVVLESIR